MEAVLSQYFVLERDHSRPVYEQLVQQVVQGVRQGTLKPGSLMPTQRQLAKELALNRNTVVKAYDQLKELGYLSAHVGRGTVITNPGSDAEFAPAKPQPAATNAELPWSQPLSEMAGRLPVISSWPHPKTADPILLATMTPSADLLPAQDLRHCLDALLKSGAGETLGYAPASGLPQLQELIAKELAGMGLNTTSEQIIITSGSSQALDLVVRCLIDRGDQVLLEDPTYHGGIQLFKLAGAHLLPLPADDHGPLLTHLPSHVIDSCKAAYLIPNFRNPTATSISRERRIEIAAFARQQGLVIIEDDYGFEFGFEDPPPPPIKSYAPEHGIYLGSFSKRLIPALRIGYIVAPKGELLERLQVMKQLVDLGNSLLLQRLLVEFMERGYYQAHIERTIPEYRRRRDAMQQALMENMPDEVDWQQPKGGLFFWLSLPDRIHVERLIDSCEESGVKISGGDVWSVRGRNVPGIRLIFCAESPERIVRGVGIVANVLREMLRKNQQPAMAVQESLV